MRITKRHLLGFAAALPLAWLTACGGSGDNGNDAHVRLVNASAGYASLDMYVDDNKEASAVTFGAGSGYADVANGEPDRTLTAAGSTTELLSQSSTLDSGKRYTVVAYGWEGALKSFLMSDDEDSADSGKTKVSAFNLAVDAGELDVYLTGESDDLATATPVVSGVDAGAQSAFTSVSSGTYRLRVTAATSKTDIRLDVSGVVLSSTDVLTLVMAPGASGVLVHAIGVVQEGDVTPYLNTKARARVVAAVANAGTVSLSAGGVGLASDVKSATIRDYMLVNAGAQTVHTAVNGTPLTDQSVTFAAGSDVTLLVSGTSAADATVHAITDDDRLPTVSTKYKLRLVHAAPSLAAENLSMTIDFSAVASDLAFGSASTFSDQTASSAATIDITTPSSGSIYNVTDVNLLAKGIYTMFMFDTINGAVGVLRKER